MRDLELGFCVCVKEFFPWLMMPLQVVYVSENKNSKKGASFSFGSGTLQGHLLVSLLSLLQLFVLHYTFQLFRFSGYDIIRFISI